MYTIGLITLWSPVIDAAAPTVGVVLWCAAMLPWRSKDVSGRLSMSTRPDPGLILGGSGSLRMPYHAL